jgi:membrane protein
MHLVSQTYRFITRFIRRTGQDRVLEWAAQFSFYLMLAFFPFLVLLTNLASQTQLVGVKVLTQLANVLPLEAYELVLDTVTDITISQKPGILSISMVVALWAASSGVFALSKGLNMANKVVETRKPWMVRGLCILFTLLIVVSFFTEILMIVFGDFILDKISSLFRVAAPFLLLGRLIRIIVPIGVVFITLAMMFILIPSRRVRFRLVLPGALFSTFFWMGTSWLFSLYVDRFGRYSRIYGGLGGVIILMIWIFISSITLLMGNEVNNLLFHHGETESDAKKNANMTA